MTNALQKSKRAFNGNLHNDFFYHYDTYSGIFSLCFSGTMDSSHKIRYWDSVEETISLCRSKNSVIN